MLTRVRLARPCLKTVYAVDGRGTFLRMPCHHNGVLAFLNSRVEADVRRIIQVAKYVKDLKLESWSGDQIDRQTRCDCQGFQRAFPL